MIKQKALRANKRLIGTAEELYDFSWMLLAFDPQTRLSLWNSALDDGEDFVVGDFLRFLSLFVEWAYNFFHWTMLRHSSEAETAKRMSALHNEWFPIKIIVVSIANAAFQSEP
jgi:hypothetical protein